MLAHLPVQCIGKTQVVVLVLLLNNNTTLGKFLSQVS